jgi:hypothetical protein
MQCKHLFLQWLTLNRVKVWETTGKGQYEQYMLPNTLQSHAPVFTGKERRLDSRFSSDNLHPFTPHCRWDDAAEHTTSCVLAVNATWSFSAGRGGKIVPGPLGRPITATLPTKMLPVSILHKRDSCLDRARVSLERRRTGRDKKIPKQGWSGTQISWLIDIHAA